MTDENQQDTRPTGSTSDSLLSTCDDVQVTIDGSDIIIGVSGTNSFTAEITVTGTNCQSLLTCIWDGQKWVCT